MKRTFYIFFNEADYLPPYMRILDHRFQHCFSYEHQLLGGFDSFVKVENLFNTVESQIFFGTKEDLLNLLPGIRCIEITLDVDPKKKTWDFMPINCVSLIKKQLGISKLFIITPKQLYTHLLAIGGKEI